MRRPSVERRRRHASATSTRPRSSRKPPRCRRWRARWESCCARRRCASPICSSCCYTATHGRITAVARGAPQVADAGSRARCSCSCSVAISSGAAARRAVEPRERGDRARVERDSRATSSRSRTRATSRARRCAAADRDARAPRARADRRAVGQPRRGRAVTRRAAHDRDRAARLAGPSPRARRVRGVRRAPISMPARGSIPSAAVRSVGVRARPAATAGVRPLDAVRTRTSRGGRGSKLRRRRARSTPIRGSPPPTARRRARRWSRWSRPGRQAAASRWSTSPSSARRPKP